MPIRHSRMLEQDTQSLLRQLALQYNYPEPSTSFVCATDIDGWVDMEFGDIRILAGVRNERHAHYCIYYDKQGMLVFVKVCVAQGALRKRKRCAASVHQHKPSTMLSATEIKPNLYYRSQNSRKENTATNVTTVSQSDGTAALHSRAERPRLRLPRVSRPARS